MAASAMTDVVHESLGTTPGYLPCVYCHEPIAAATFIYWSGAKRLLSAPCPSCLRRVTLAAATWRRWLRGPAS